VKIELRDEQPAITTYSIEFKVTNNPPIF